MAYVTSIQTDKLSDTTEQRITNVLSNKATERNDLKLKTGLMAAYLVERFNGLVNG